MQFEPERLQRVMDRYGYQDIELLPDGMYGIIDAVKCTLIPVAIIL